jgi:signal peptidase I
VGLAGETLMVRAGQVYVDGQRLNESYIVTQGGGDYGPAVIPPLHVFVLGDNRGASNDSRRFGPVALSQVVGHAWFSYWPPDYIGLVQ